MHLSSAVYAVLLTVFAIVLVALLVRYARREHASVRKELEDIVVRLKDVDRQAIALVAQDEEHTLEPQDVVSRLGGLKGLEALEFNAEVLIELATYLQRWHPEVLPAAEQLRLNARKLQWNVGRLRGATSNGHLLAGFPAYVQSAAEIYYSMTREVLRLYEHFDSGDLSYLQRTI